MRRRGLLGVAAAAPLLAAADSPPAMSEAQILLFETPHLAALQPPLRLRYGFRRTEPARAPVEDSITLTLRAAAEAGRFDVTPEFLTGPRAIRYPPAPGFRGNPLLLFALDRDVREMSAAMGGSMGWFRNRIRHALAEAAVQRIDLAFEGRQVPAAEILLAPFTGEPRAGRCQDRRYRFVLAAAVPGWIASIVSDTPAGDAAGHLREAIAFEAALPLPERAG